VTFTFVKDDVTHMAHFNASNKLKSQLSVKTWRNSRVFEISATNKNLTMKLGKVWRYLWIYIYCSTSNTKGVNGFFLKTVAPSRAPPDFSKVRKVQFSTLHPYCKTFPTVSRLNMGISYETFLEKIPSQKVIEAIERSSNGKVVASGKLMQHVCE
jgi:hypothetical protein